MAERRPSLMEPRIETLMSKVDSKFTLVTLAAMRAREINDYYNQLGEGLGRIVPPQVTSVSRKPLSIALEEIAANKIVVRAHRARGRRGRRRGRRGRGRRRRRPTRRPDRAGRTSRRRPSRRPMPRVVLGVCGGIAAYKAVEVCRRLVDAGVHVAPVLTDDAQRFVGALTFSALASEPARTSLFGGPEPIPHTRLGQSADLVVVAPATAKLLGKYAAGISDDLLTATLLATRAPGARVPGDAHRDVGARGGAGEPRDAARAAACTCSSPRTGRLAGGDVGAGRLADPARIVDTRARAPRRATARWRAARVAGDRGRDARGRSIRCASSATGRRGRWVTRSRTSRARRGRAGRARHDRAPAGRRRASRSCAVESAQEMHDAVMRPRRARPTR